MNRLIKSEFYTIPTLGDSNLTRHYAGGETTPFGEGANYTCKEGLFFEDDHNMTHFSLECFANGTFEEPEAWPRCLHPSG